MEECLRHLHSVDDVIFSNSHEKLEAKLQNLADIIIKNGIKNKFGKYQSDVRSFAP